MNAILHELEFYVGKTMALAAAGKPYQEVIDHIGQPPPHHQEELDDDLENGVSDVSHTSQLFTDITFHLGSGETAGQVVAMDFFARPGSFTMDDMAAVFGPWHRAAQGAEDILFVPAWFERYDKSSGARLFLYADDAGKSDIVIAAGHTPGRVFFTTIYDRDED
jgi:hypothetical protein